jgi:hypothetical protein
MVNHSSFDASLVTASVTSTTNGHASESLFARNPCNYTHDPISNYFQVLLIICELDFEILTLRGTEPIFVFLILWANLLFRLK